MRFAMSIAIATLFTAFGLLAGSSPLAVGQVATKAQDSQKPKKDAPEGKKASKPDGVAGAAAKPQGSVEDELKKRIASGKILFDSDHERREILGENTGTPKVAADLQRLIVVLADTAPKPIRISSVIRDGDPGFHGKGRAADIGNEEIANALLPKIATDARVAALKIDEIIFDAKVAGQADRNHWNYDQGKKHNYNAQTLDEHRNHIHFAVKP